jgi:phosphoglycerol transferase MdoB-like AlkP superfamily enzyme
MEKLTKKELKAEHKARKKEAKLKQYQRPDSLAAIPEKESKGVRFAHMVKGTLYVILAVSLFLALLLGQTGYILSLDEIINKLIFIIAGKIILIVIALAFLIYGLKHLKIVR